ncbi:MAG: metallophosphoesterase [Synergistaceae bacterium]|jgi:predicted MPP superfamily phosphohydrolase|nr:metallophosphoesterase [Synergistaceae bacterium]
MIRGEMEMFYNAKGMAFFMGAYFCALLYSGANLAFFGRGEWKIVVLALWLLSGLSLPLGIFQKRYSPQLRRVGGVALAFVLHLSAAFLFLNAWTLLASRTTLDAPSPRAAAISLNAMLLWIAYGVARAQRIVARAIHVDLLSPAPRPPVVLLAVADIHAGGVVEERYLKRLQKRVAQCRPDVLLLLGDITDGDVSRAVGAGLGEVLASFSAPLGKYAVLGNHDIYAGEKASLRLLRDAGFETLQDEARVVDDAFVLVGRNDPRGRHFGLPRAPLRSILDGLDGPATKLPVVVADHTPQNLEEAESVGVALQLSGHTHGGQVFPFNLMMRWIYGLSSGSQRRGNTTVCVSSGAGLWTMPLRTVTDSEIVLCTLSFKPRNPRSKACDRRVSPNPGGSCPQNW